MEEDRTLQNILYESQQTPETDKDTTKKRKLQVNIFDEYTYKTPQLKY